MSQDTGTITPEQGGAPSDAPETEWTPPATQAELDRVIGERLKRQKAQFSDYDDLKAKAAEYDKFAESQKTELEKVAERAAKAEAERAEAQSELARTRVALKHKLTDDDLKMLGTGTEEEIEERAAYIASLRAAANETPPSFDGGAQTPAPSGGDMNALIRRQLRG